jgi:hypothetical protein
MTVRNSGGKYPKLLYPDERQGSATMSGSMLYALKAWIVLAAFYLFLAGQFSTTEVIAGAPAATMVAAFAALLHRARTRHLRLHAPWPLAIGRPLASLFPDAFRVGAILLSALWRRPAGSAGLITTQPFRRGDDSADDAGRRGLVTLGASLAPNRYVLGLRDDQDALVMHCLAPAPPRPDREWPL